MDFEEPAGEDNPQDPEDLYNDKEEKGDDEDADGNWEPEDEKFKCRHCDQTFASASGCNSHERNKHSKRTPGRFVCDICGRGFRVVDYLRTHKKRHKLADDGTPLPITPKMISTEDGKYQCFQCDQIFSRASSCRAHIRDKHSKTPGAFICDLCGRTFNSQDYLRNHMTSSHKLKADGTPIPPKCPKSPLEKGPNICDLCGKGLSTSQQLQRHTQFVHERRFNFNCNLCGKGCPNRNALKKHQLALHPEDPSTKKFIEDEGLNLLKCPVIGCTARYLKESSVQSHLKSIHGKGVDAGAAGVVFKDPLLKVTCPTCGRTCPNKQALGKHEKRMHGNLEKDFICEICGKGFVSKQDLSYVDGVHLKKGFPKNFKCELCGKAFRKGCLLRRHLEIHEKEGKRDYFCDKCRHGFITEHYLRKHKSQTNCGVEGKMARVYERKNK